jgi:hypothetical protein
MSRIFALIVVVFVVALFFGMRDGKERKFERMQRSMIHGCVDGAVKQMPADTAQKYCDCTIGRLVKDNGYEKLDANIHADPSGNPAWLNAQMQRDAQECAASLGMQMSFPNR